MAQTKEYLKEYYLEHREERLEYQRQYIAEQKGGRRMLKAAGDGLINEEELREYLGVTAYGIKLMWGMGLRYVSIRGSRGPRFYLASEIIAWAKRELNSPDAEPQEK